MKPTGAVFFRDTEGLDAKKLIAKVCDGGRITSDDARLATGTERVGFAVHPPRRGCWAIVDSAAGALGIGSGDWSKVALAANHLPTEAAWYRTYALDLALAVYFPRGGTWMRAYVGITDDVLGRLDADGFPVHDAQPPATATDALCVTVAYDPGSYDTGPDAAVARDLLAIHEALVAGDADGLRLHLDTVTDATRALALAVIRGADRGAWRTCLEAYAAQLVAEPPRMRIKHGQLTFDEEVLRRVAETVESPAMFEAALAHLDAIEVEADARSSHAYVMGVAMLAHQLGQRGALERVLACELRLIRRKDPAWHVCNQVLASLLKRSPLTLDATVREVIACVEARLPALGQGAVDPITYNLACVHARCGDLEAALAALRRCKTPLAQNPHPEQDPDLEPLWSHPELLAMIARKDEHEEEDDVEDEPLAPRVDYVPPAEHAVPRLAIRFEPRPEAEGALIDRLGGKPNAPASSVAWPSSSSRPMDFVAQLVGTAAGGSIELGDIHALQIFADLEGEFYEEGEHAVIAHRAPCVAVVEPPPTVTVAPVRAIVLTPGFDDRRIDDWELELDDARSHAWVDKVFGVPVGANLEAPRGADGAPLRLICELVRYDDYFLWALFADQALTTFRLEIVRG